MKKILLGAMITMCTVHALAQPSWTWLKGNPEDLYAPGYGVYGTKGVAAARNRPGIRSGAASWQDSAGVVWVMGGSGYSKTGSGLLNDLWKYAPVTGNWTWVSGDQSANQYGVYGIKGTPAPQNRPRARTSASTAIDGNGNLWLFGGTSFNEPNLNNPFGSTYLNDLWMFSPSTSMWTWMGGDTIYKTVPFYPGSYGTKGTAAPTNKPGSRQNAPAWSDGNGNFWMYGGNGVNSSTLGALSDLWKFDRSSGYWTWVSGDITLDQQPVFGMKGATSAIVKPGVQASRTNWVDDSGNLWLYGATVSQYNVAGFIPANNLWKFSLVSGTWAWIGGDGSVANPMAPFSKPAGRAGTVWREPNGNLWLFGGQGLYTSGFYNDIWKYDPVADSWTWKKGDTVLNPFKIPAVYGQQGVPSDSSHPESRIYTTKWTDNQGNLWLLADNQVWKYATALNQWTWIQGDTISNFYTIANIAKRPVYGLKGVAASTNDPGTRIGGMNWKDSAGNLWLYGGSVYLPQSNYPYLASDLWKFTPQTNQWTWTGGDSSMNKPVNYGTMGVSSDSSTPGTRAGSITWKDASGDLWMFASGTLPATRGPDLWRYAPATQQWVWVSGGRNNPYSVYPADGGRPSADTSAPHPGARISAATWTDQSGNLWMFGGQGHAADGLIFGGYGNYGKLNDLWKLSPATATWTYMGGSKTTRIDNSSISGIYGTRRVASASSWPGGRAGASAWIDSSGDFWLFGGVMDTTILACNCKIEESLNDLWKYSPSTGQWTWMSGDTKPAQSGVYGTPGQVSALNKPGARNGAILWGDATQKLFLFGGKNDSTTVNISRKLNDLWEYSVESDRWTWLGGDSTVNAAGNYGTGSSSVQPGARSGSIFWSDTQGNLWLFGGYGYGANGPRYLDDLLKFSVSAALPILFSRFTAQKQGESVQLNWTTAQEQNSQSFLIERSADGAAFSKIGTVASAGNSSIATSYAFTDFVPLTGDNYYRLKEVDKDGKSQYSTVQKLSFGNVAGGFRIFSNPVQLTLRMHLDAPAAQAVELKVRDASGHLLISKKTTLVTGSNALQISVDQLPPGTYFLQVESKDLHGTKAFVKQ